jgi:hypothetical protein
VQYRVAAEAAALYFYGCNKKISFIVMSDKEGVNILDFGYKTQKAENPRTKL